MDIRQEIGALNDELIELRRDFHHHPRFNIDEKALHLGVELHVRAALKYLVQEK